MEEAPKTEESDIYLRLNTLQFLTLELIQTVKEVVKGKLGPESDAGQVLSIIVDLSRLQLKWLADKEAHDINYPSKFQI